MIIEARGDVVGLSGSLEKNQWPAIQAAANLLMRVHPAGILIDAAGITSCSDEGARTFRDAMEYIDRHRARIVVCGPPESVLETLSHIPGLRSQLPIAETCDQGRTSLELADDIRRQARQARRGGDGSPVRPRLVMVPLMAAEPDLKGTVGLALSVGSIEPANLRDSSAGNLVAPILHFLYLLEVPRTIPINAPMAEAETTARELIDQAAALSEELGIVSQSSVLRTREVREAGEETIAHAAELGVEILVLSLPGAREPGRDEMAEFVDMVLHRAQCEVVVKNWTSGKKEGALAQPMEQSTKWHQ